ncbi:cytochrome c family protein [Pseudomonas sp. N3-W]|uniref:cytochrome c3 family protein n=1 Tax=Pseudomonas sp. N3-W TaxID=2975049 RepID=UPI00217E8CBB|nr:cytochrome c3 family protein [Pseudomonas sp. N3-W]UWF46691.1 cytochrome c family protein [Pseudomonas sp. N3-W]
MAQIFRRSADTWLRLGLLMLLVAVLGGLLVALTLDSTDYRTGRDWVIDQPLPFSHAHHAGQLQIDCRYCHASVESSAMASLPPTETCMTCHSQIWKQSDVLEPLRKSLRDLQPLHWNRVVDLPDYVYFHHGVHVNAGVGCSECHGQVDRMQLLFKAEPLNMGQCLACHRDPAPHLRPLDQVTNLHWHTDEDRRVLGERLMKARHIDTAGLTDCGTCHR